MNLDREQANTEDETPVVDIEAASAQIGSELFEQQADGEDQAGEQGESDDGEASAEVVDSPATSKEGEVGDEAKQAEGDGVAAEENAQAVQDTGAPKTWTKEALEKWATIDPLAQAEILKREQDFLNGITQYKAGAELGQRYDAVVEPYRAILTAENIDPVQLFQSFSANHYLLSKGTDDQKIQLAAHMVEHYKIPLAGLLEYLGEKEENPVSPEIIALRNELNELKSGLTQKQQADKSAIQEQINAEVDAFANDPANVYFEELAQDIQLLFEKGLAKTMSEAYEKALWSNPTTRAKETERLRVAAAAEASEAEKARLKEKAKAQAANLTVKSHQRDGTVVTAGSMDDTLNETLAAIQARENSE